MAELKTSGPQLADDTHGDAAEAFVEHSQAACGEGFEELYMRLGNQ